MIYAQLLFIAGFIYGIRLMASPRTAVAGNILGAVSMLGAILVTLAAEGIISAALLWAGLALGTLLGIYLAYKVLMIQMPQMVALLNGFGGGASALVALLAVLDPAALNPFTSLTTGLAITVGGVTLSGSLVAAAKLHGLLPQRPVHYRCHNQLTWLSIAALAAGTLFLVFFPAFSGSAALALTALALFFGYIFTIRVGGADMPITISLLNSFSGVAGAAAGFALHNTLLVTVGAVVGASGLILTQIMCRAMNRSLMQILLGRTTVAGQKPQPELRTAVKEYPPAETPGEKNRECIQALRRAEKIVIIPGYGLA